MKHWIAAAVLICFCAIPARAEWNGKLDLASMPSVGAWQSVTNADQALGASKNLAMLQKDGRDILRLGVFAGSFKPVLSEPSSGPRVLGGVTIMVPGSDLDWALGTSWGDMWLPKLKTGMLAGYDLTRPSALHPRPDFIGVGLSYKVGAN